MNVDETRKAYQAALEDAEGWAPGDEVWGYVRKAAAEHIVALEARNTALEALVEVLPNRPGFLKWLCEQARHYTKIGGIAVDVKYAFESEMLGSVDDELRQTVMARNQFGGQYRDTFNHAIEVFNAAADAGAQEAGTP